MNDRGTRNGIEHPLRNQTPRAISYDDHDAIDATLSTAPKNLNRFAEKRVVLIVDCDRTRNASSV